MKKILVLLGPNLNMIGVREKGIYGTETAESIDAQIRELRRQGGLRLRNLPVQLGGGFSG